MADLSGSSQDVSLCSVSDMSPACPECTISAHPAPHVVQKPHLKARASFRSVWKSDWMTWGPRPRHLFKVFPVLHLRHSAFEALLCPPSHLLLLSLAGLSRPQPSVRGDVLRG